MQTMIVWHFFAENNTKNYCKREKKVVYLQVEFILTPPLFETLP